MLSTPDTILSRLGYKGLYRDVDLFPDLGGLTPSRNLGDPSYDTREG